MRDPAIPDLGAIEPGTHIFILKIWREDAGSGEQPVVWRGHISHVASGQRRYITGLLQMILFIVPYIQALNVRLPLFWRLCQRFKRYQ